MKKMILWFLFAMLITVNAWAKPERIAIKEAGKHAKEKAAKAQMKNIDLKNIEDPEARRAIRELYNYLDLKTK